MTALDRILAAHPEILSVDLELCRTDPAAFAASQAPMTAHIDAAVSEGICPYCDRPFPGTARSCYPCGFEFAWSAGGWCGMVIPPPNYTGMTSYATAPPRYFP